MTKLLHKTPSVALVTAGLASPSSASPLGEFDRTFFPEPVFESQPEFVDLYWTAWKLAWEKMRDDEGMPQTPYIDEAHSADVIWIWDTCFMVLFAKYAADTIPGIETLNNFYAPFHDGVDIPVRIQHPDNPPLFAWVEHDYYRFTNDATHLKQLITEDAYLQKHYNWVETVKPGSHVGRSRETHAERVANGYHWHGLTSGMDNTPRGGGNHAGYQSILWVDLLAQQGLSALYISRLAEQLGEEEIARTWRDIYEEQKALLNELYWNEEDGVYYDINANTLEHHKVKTPATYWPMLAEMCSPEQAARLAAQIEDDEIFGGVIPLPSVARNDPAFVSPDGEYWRGGVWLPTSYMSIKAIEKYGFYDIAHRTARKTLDHMLTTYQTVEPATIWEAYSPDRPHPAGYKPGRKRQFARKDFCGWSALGPISLFIENIMGFHTVDADARLVEWNYRRENQAHGIKRLRFGDIETDITVDAEGQVTVQSNADYTLKVNDHEHAITSGKTQFTIK